MSPKKAALLLALLTLPLSAAAQDWKGVGRMAGKVLDPDGKPIADAVVKLELPGRGGTTLKTDKKGQWTLGGIAAGVWNLDLEAPGFVPKRMTVTLPGESVRIPPVEVKLEKPEGPPPELLAALNNGDAAFKAQRYAEARAEYEKALAHERIRGAEASVRVQLHRQIAFCLSREKNYLEELEHLQAVLELEPQNIDVKMLLASEAIEGDLIEKAVEVLATVPDSAVTSPDIFYNIGVSFRNKNKGDAAIVYFTKSVVLDPTYVDGYFQRGLTYFGQQKLAEAKADFLKVVELAPAGPQGQTARQALEQLK
jgi:tetratricopeptide (TPR) repeat protein